MNGGRWETRELKRLGSVLVLILALAGTWAVAQAQESPAPSDQQELPALPPNPDRALSPGEVQQLFDAFTAAEAQEQLGLDEEQYGQFVARFKVLQDARRQHQQRRIRLIQEMARLTRRQAATADEAVLKARIDALELEDAEAAVTIAKAYEAVDELLDTRQRARFRVFEDQMERRKLELLMRVRQQNRQQRRLQSPS